MTRTTQGRPVDGGAGKRRRPGVVVSAMSRLGADRRRARLLGPPTGLVRGGGRGLVRAHRPTAMVMVALLGGGLTACSGGDHVGGGVPAPATAAPSTAEKPAALVIATASQFAEERQGAKAAVDYINDELGGVTAVPCSS